MSARYSLPIGRRSPRPRRQRHEDTAHLDEWLRQVERVLASRADLRVGPVAADGLVLVESASVEFGSHECRIERGAAVSCSCLHSRTRKAPCAHRAAVAIALWEAEFHCDLSAVPAKALVPTLVRAYLEPPKERRRFRLSEGDAALNETHLEETAC